MYQKAYKEIARDDSKVERTNEAMAMDHAIALMEEGESKGMRSVEAVKARHFVHRLWFYFLDDLALPENGLPDQLKAQLISIGIWAIKEVERIESGDSKGFSDLIEVMKIIRDGLK